MGKNKVWLAVLVVVIALVAFMPSPARLSVDGLYPGMSRDQIEKTSGRLPPEAECRGQWIHVGDTMISLADTGRLRCVEGQSLSYGAQNLLARGDSVDKIDPTLGAHDSVSAQSTLSFSGSGALLALILPPYVSDSTPFSYWFLYRDLHLEIKVTGPSLKESHIAQFILVEP